MKQILSLDNPITDKNIDNENNNLIPLQNILGNYVINSDNFIKMVLIFYRIKSNIPVIIMGETGCGKTSLIRKLNEILNNGKSTLEIFNIHSVITDKDIIEKMKYIKGKGKKRKNMVIF